MSPLNPLNPAAGDVPIPEDQREIDAALRAGEISHRIFPYFKWRYGERGNRFTHSDSAWLAWLTRFDQERVSKEIIWLRGILSNRGMPSFLLETHLRVMQRQLTRKIPDNKDEYMSLANSASQLRQTREEMIPPSRELELIHGFSRRVCARPSSLVGGAAKLLVAAVADELLGIKKAVPSLETWLIDVPSLRKIMGLRQMLGESDLRLLDSKSFEQRWKDAVTTTIVKARSG